MKKGDALKRCSYNKMTRRISTYSLVLIVVTGLILPLSTFALPCTDPHTCGASTACDSHVKKMTYAAFETWLNANQWTAFDVVAFNSSYVVVVTSENCSTKYSCWDSQGECAP